MEERKEVNEVFRKRLRSLRRHHKLTQEEVANLIGIPRSTYAGYEKCLREAGYEVLINLATLFDVSIDYLLGLSEAPKQGQGKNAASFFQQEGLHWDGVLLEEKDLYSIRDLLEKLVHVRSKITSV